MLWLDTLIHCSGIHNYLSSSTPFSPFEKLFLSNGLRFICTPPSTQFPIFQSHYFDDQSRGWPRFQRALINRLKHGADSNDDYLAKFSMASPRSTEHATNHAREQLQQFNTQAFAILDQYCRSTLDLLTRSALLSHHQQLVRHQHVNHTPRDLKFIRRLMEDASITIKPADKNLGMCLVDTDWYIRELQRMLKDRVTYKPFNYIDSAGKPCTLRQLQERIFNKLKQIASEGQRTLESWHPQHADQALKYLTHASSATTCKVPDIYLLIKVHKAAGLSGRPIVPSTRWLTTPASVLVDHLLQEVMRDAGIAHIVKDTKSFINELEHTTVTLPTRDGVFITADIASLYTNIDTKLGLRLVREFLQGQKIARARIDLIMSLLSFVMTNSYLNFRDQIYHQIDGTAMGTACAPTYANIVVYMLEKDLITEFAGRVHIYRRFLDDVFAYLDEDVAEEFVTRMNSLHPKLRFEFIRHPTEASFLDLRIHKGSRFANSAVFDLSVHQKKMNLYLYIPFRSFHTDAMKRSFIQTELMRYIRNSSDGAEYMKLKHVFFQRLRDRGYPSTFLLPIFNSIFYSDRELFLWPSATLHKHPLIHTARSLCLQRRMQRWNQARSATESTSPLVFVIPYSPLSRLLSTRRILSRQWGQVRDALGEPSLPHPIIAYQSAPSLGKTLVFQRARNLEEARRAQTTPPAAPTRQTTLASFLDR